MAKDTAATHTAANGSAPPRKARARSTQRAVSAGDTAPSLRPSAIAAHTVGRATTGARTEQAMALADVLAHHAQGESAGTVLGELQTLMDGASADDRKALRKLLFQPVATPAEKMPTTPWRPAGARANTRTRTCFRGAGMSRRNTSCRWNC